MMASIILLLLLFALSVSIAGAASFAYVPTIPEVRATKGAPKSSHGASIGDADIGASETMDDPLDRSGTDSFRQRNSRRSFLSSFATSAVLGSSASPARAAKGAAEYDLEYYMRDLFLGNNREGNLPASSAPPIHPPRVLKGPLLPLLLDNELQSCIPIQELAKLTNIPISTLSEQIKKFRTKVEPAFRVTHPWKEESVSDEYYFDLTCYSLWRTASVAIPNYSQRDVFMRNIGRRLLLEITSRGMISNKSMETLNGNGQKALALTDTVPCVIEILDLFSSSNYCTSYRLGDKNDVERTGKNMFDALDDKDISSGAGSVNCLVSIFDPGELGGALQITGEGSRFTPDFIGPTLAAVWEGMGADVSGGGMVLVGFESYFVDPVYRPNPKVRIAWICRERRMMRYFVCT